MIKQDQKDPNSHEFELIFLKMSKEFHRSTAFNLDLELNLVRKISRDSLPLPKPYILLNNPLSSGLQFHLRDFGNMVQFQRRRNPNPRSNILQFPLQFILFFRRIAPNWNGGLRFQGDFAAYQPRSSSGGSDRGNRGRRWKCRWGAPERESWGWRGRRRRRRGEYCKCCCHGFSFLLEVK